MRERILRCRVTPDPNLSRKDLFGHDEAYDEILRTIFLPLKYPHIYQLGLNIPRSVLLFGPPGCGKSYLVRVLASDVSLDMFNVSAGVLMSKWFGESQKMIRIMFETVWEHAPSVLFIDEFDSIFGRRTSPKRHYRFIPPSPPPPSETLLQIQKETESTR